MYHSIDVKQEEPRGSLTLRKNAVQKSLAEKSSMKFRNAFSFISDYNVLSYRSTSAFKNNVLLAARTGLGVLIASVVQTRKKVGGAEYMFLPSTYYLGGLTYATTSVIFSAGRNLGGTLREAWESLCGVGIALLFNVLLFAAGMEITGKDLTMYSHFSLASENIVVSNVDIQTFYPIILVYTFVILLAPLQTGTKKFAIGMNLFFLLRLLNPNNPDGSDGIKDTTNPDNESNLFTVENILERFLMYSAVGAWGCFVAVLMILVPYPIIAMRQMQIVIKQAHAELHDLLNVLIDVFATFKVHEKVNGDIAQMDLILEMKIEKMLAKCDNRLADMVELIDCIWWEQLFGLNLILKINKVVYKLYVRMYQGLLVHLHEMYKGVKNKHRQSKSDQSQVQIYRNIRKQLYKVQSIAAQHFQDITAHVCVSDIHMRLPRTPALENALSKLNKSLKAQAKTILEMDEITSSMSSIEGKHRRNMHVFLFHFISICEILKSFEKQFKTKHFGTRYRTWHFICRALGTAFDKKHYTWSHVLAAFKITTAIAIGLLPAIFVYGYSATTPSAIAYVMSRNLTGSYNTTMDRVLGVVAGSIVPSIFKFFISHISTYWTQLLVNNLFLFCWVTMSVYVFFSSPSHFYAGQVSAFIAAAILLRPILIFQPGDSLSETTSKELLASYMGLMETSMGLLILVVVELLFYPRSSITLLRVNMQQSLQNLSSCFTLSTKAIVSSNPIKPSDKNPKELRKMIDNTLPALLDKQKDLLQGAQVEPSLWRPKFSSTKYNYICKDCTTLFNNIKSISILIYGSENIQTNNGFTPIIESTERDALLHWCSTIPWPRIIHEGFSSMSLLLDPKHLFSPTDDTAVYLQMKEAFHAVDRDGDGIINTSELRQLCTRVLAQDKVIPTEIELTTYVESLLNALDTNGDGSVSFEEYVTGIENVVTASSNFTSRAPTSSLLDSFAILHSTSIHSNSIGPLRKLSSMPSSDLFDFVDQASLESCLSELETRYLEWIQSAHDHLPYDKVIITSCFVSNLRNIILTLLHLEQVTLME